MQNRLRMFLFCTLSVMTVAANDPKASSNPDPNTARLGAFIGSWQSEGKTYETTYSHADQITSRTTCNWSLNSSYLICDQINHDAKGVSHNQLTIYAYNSKDNNYTYTSFQDAGQKPYTGTLTIEGNTWTYSGGSFEDNGKKIRFRTINVFHSGADDFRIEYQENDGPWKTSGEGTFRKAQ